MYVWGSGNSGKWLGMYAGCVRFCPADSALGVTGGFVTGAEIYRIETQAKKLSSQPRQQPLIPNFLTHTRAQQRIHLRAVITILCDLLAYTGRVSALKPAVRQTD